MGSPIINAIFVSDTHCGCKLGLSPERFMLDEGGSYLASAAQNSVREMWDYCWQKWVPLVTKGEPYVVVFNGDAIDGCHHNSTHQITHNISKQIDIAYEMMAPQREKADAWYHIKGTEVHVGQSGEDEETLARRLGAEANDIGQYARYDMNLMVGDGLINVLHHIGTTGSTAYETTALTKEFGEMCSEAGRWGHRPPDAVVRSHRHRCSMTTLPTGNGYGISVTTPGWQLKTPFCYRAAGVRISTPQFGMIAFRYGDEDQLYCRHWIRTIKQSTPERPEIVIPVQKGAKDV